MIIMGRIFDPAGPPPPPVFHTAPDGRIVRPQRTATLKPGWHITTADELADALCPPPPDVTPPDETLPELKPIGGPVEETYPSIEWSEED